MHKTGPFTNSGVKLSHYVPRYIILEFVLECEPSSGSIHFSAYGFIARSHISIGVCRVDHFSSSFAPMFRSAGSPNTYPYPPFCSSRFNAEGISSGTEFTIARVYKCARGSLIENVRINMYRGLHAPRGSRH